MTTSTEEGMDATKTTENGLNGQHRIADAIAKLEPDTDESEIKELHTAISKVLAKIQWHEEQIEERRQDIKGHEDQIEELRKSLRKHVGPLINQSAIIRQKIESKSKNLRETGDSATRKLICEALSKSGKPMDTKQVKDFLEKHGNTTNPSVELSRMVKRGQLERAERGLYQLKK